MHIAEQGRYKSPGKVSHQLPARKCSTCTTQNKLAVSGGRGVPAVCIAGELQTHGASAYTLQYVRVHFLSAFIYCQLATKTTAGWIHACSRTGRTTGIASSQGNCRSAQQQQPASRSPWISPWFGGNGQGARIGEDTAGVNFFLFSADPRHQYIRGCLVRGTKKYKMIRY